MKSRLRLAVALTGVFTLVLAGAVQAQQKPNFSGTWKLDKDKSTWGNPRIAPSSLVETIDHKRADAHHYEGRGERSWRIDPTAEADH